MTVLNLDRIFRETLNPEEYARLFSPEGLARQCGWDCEDGWYVAYTTSRIEGGTLAGKFAVMAYRPVGKGARSGTPRRWERAYVRAYARRKTARRRAEVLYYRHSPRAAERHGVGPGFRGWP